MCIFRYPVLFTVTSVNNVLGDPKSTLRLYDLPRHKRLNNNKKPLMLMVMFIIAKGYR
jgi:hypothetical protein